MDVSKNWGGISPKIDGENNGKPLLKWMIWGYPYFWKHPNGWKEVFSSDLLVDFCWGELAFGGNFFGNV